LAEETTAETAAVQDFEDDGDWELTKARGLCLALEIFDGISKIEAAV
jgi:hypothetical protein